MPKIVPSADLRNHYKEISEYCKEKMEPVYITVNGREDLAIVSIPYFERQNIKIELLKILIEGLADNNETTLDEIREEFGCNTK